MNKKTKLSVLTEENFRNEVLEYNSLVLVLFEANWCGFCKIIAPVIKQLADEYKDQIKICRLDVDTNRKITEQYCVQNLPTLIFFKNGEVVDYITGVFPKKLVRSILEPLLKNKKSQYDT